MEAEEHPDGQDPSQEQQEVEQLVEADEEEEEDYSEEERETEGEHELPDGEHLLVEEDDEFLEEAVEAGPGVMGEIVLEEHLTGDTNDDSLLYTEEICEELDPDENPVDTGELIGIDREDREDDLELQLQQVVVSCGGGGDSDGMLRGFVGVEIKEEELEIKEEEIEIEDDIAFNSMDDEDFYDDPILGLPRPLKYDSEGNEVSGKQKEGEKSSSETDTADEVGNVVMLVDDEHGYHQKVEPPPEQRKRKYTKKKKALPPLSSLPKNVRGLVVTDKNLSKCLECKKKFHSMVAFLKHHMIHRRASRYLHLYCSYCPYKFRNSRDKLIHLMKHSKLEAMTCPICSIQVHSAQSLAQHMDIHRQQIDKYYFQCTMCLVRFSSRRQLEAHKSVVHSLRGPGRNINKQRTVYICFHCGKVEDNWSDLLVHMRCHKGPLQCTLCQTSMPNSDAFANHVIQLHKDKGELTYHSCSNPSCSKEFVSLKELVKHETICQPTGGEFRCEICEQIYREVDHFTTHIKLHAVLSDEGSHNRACPHCSAQATNPADYAMHLVTDHGYRDRLETVQEAYAEYMKMPFDARSTEGSSSEEEEEEHSTEAKEKGKKGTKQQHQQQQQIQELIELE